jgi:glyoxylase-like metal-dependent hydrolase (beta-lactamase superfamily II)
MLESYARAKSLIDAAVAAHGGVEALRAARHMRITLQGNDFHRNQSRRVAAPYDSTPRRHEVLIDLSRGQVISVDTRGYPGGFSYNTGFITNGTKGFALNWRQQSYSTAEYPPADQQFGQLFNLPQWMVLVAHELTPASGRRYLGPIRLASGAIVEAVHMALPGGGAVTLGFDPDSHRLHATTSVGTDIFAGDTQVDTEYLDYRMLDGVLLPTRRVTWRGGEIINDVTYTSATPNYVIPDSLIAPPARFSAAAPPTTADPVRELAPGVWGIRAGGAWSLVVAFTDHVMVIDAPPSAPTDVIARVATLAPGKPIRYVVPTHHHDDHFGGVRRYASTGATTVTTSGNLDYFRRIVRAPSTTLQPNPAPPVPTAKVEAIENRRRTFTDGSRTVEIHDIGPSPHADEMLVAWLPNEGILFQADLIEVPQSGIAARGTNAETTVHLANFIRRQRWNVRVLAGAHAFLASPAELDRIVQQPILPPW